MSVQMVGVAANLLLKIAQSVKAFQRIKEIRDKKSTTTAEKVDMVAHAAFAILQAGELGSVGASKLFGIVNKTYGEQAIVSRLTAVLSKVLTPVETPARIFAGLTAAGCAISKPFAEKGGLEKADWLNFVAVLAFRGGDGITEFHKAYPDYLEWDPETVKYATNLLTALSEVITNREDLEQARVCIRDKLKEIGLKILEWISRMKNGAPAGDPPEDPPVALNRLRIAEDRPANPVNMEEAVANAAADIAVNQIRALIQGLTNDFNEILEIPEILHRHPAQMQNVCPITENPIRFVVVPRLPDRELEENRGFLAVQYERSAIETWLRDRPNENPPRWPAHIPFNEENLRRSPERQWAILQNLRIAAEEYRQYEELIIPQIIDNRARAAEPVPLNRLPLDEINPVNRDLAFANNEIRALIQGVTNNFIEVREIPQILHHYPALRENVCCISGNPIRFIRVPRLPLEDLQADPALLAVQYERSAIQTWLRDRSNENPPSWPAHLPLNQDNVRQSPRRQSAILQNLRAAVEELRQSSQVITRGLTNNFIEVREIPQILHRHPALRENVCAISGNPIRFIVVPRLPDRVLEENREFLEVEYERSAIQNWTWDHPNENPPGWPAHIPFNEENLIESTELQRAIRENLTAVAYQLLEFTDEQTIDRG